MPNHAGLRQLLKMVSDLRAGNHNMTHLKFPGGAEGLVLSEGQEFSEMAANQPRFGRQGECFKNALLLALANRDLFYAEGYALVAECVPVHHAWCVDREGHIYEPTWKPKEPRPYLGVVFDTKFALDRVSENGYYGLLTNAYHACPKMLAGDFVKAEI